MKKITKIFIFALFVSLIMTTVAFAQLKVGTKAPDFSLSTLKGDRFILYDAIKEAPKVFVVNIFTNGCASCKQQLPYIAKLSKEFPGKPVTFIGISIDSDKAVAKSLADAAGIDYTVGIDPYGEKVGKDYQITGIPTVFIIDSKGIIRYSVTGFPTYPAYQKDEIEKIEKQIKTLISEIK